MSRLGFTGPNRAALVAGGGVETVVAAMDLFREDVEVKDWGCRALAMLTFGGCCRYATRAWRLS
jgi:hypothetical protein